MNARAMRRRDALALGALGVGTLLLGGCSAPLIAPPGVWFNAIKTRKSDAKRLCNPTTIQDLVSIIQTAEREGETVRAVGSGHSFSNVALTTGYLVLPNGLNKILPIPRGQLEPEHVRNKHLVRIESGVTVRDINDWLDKHELALDNMGGWDAQTIVGAVSTGTHGTGLRYGPFASWVKSIQVVGTGGEIFQIEPTNGITKKADHVNTPEGVRAKLIQDDDTFNAAVIGLGCLGVVYSVIFEAVPKFWILERRTLRRWTELKKSFLEPLLAGVAPDSDHYNVLVNPYEKVRDHTCLFIEQFRRKRPSRGWVGDRARPGDALQALPVEIPFIQKGAIDLLNSEDTSGVREIIDAAMQEMQEIEGDEYENLSYRVFNLGPVNGMRAYAIELAFDLRDTLAAVEKLFAIASEESRESGRHHPSPVSLRFVKAGDALLAPQQGRDTMMIEIGMLVGIHEGPDLLQRYAEEFLCGKPQARPHWGLDLDLFDGNKARELFPKFSVWEGIYRKLNAKGTFDGPLTDRLGISMRPRPASHE